MDTSKNANPNKKVALLLLTVFSLFITTFFFFSPARVFADVFNENDYVRNAYGVEFQNETDANYPAYTLDYIKTGNGGLKLRTGNVYGPAGNNSSPFDIARLGIGKDPTTELDVLGTIAGNILQLFSAPSGLGQIQFNGTNFQWRQGTTGTWNEFGGSITGGDCPAGQFATGVNVDGTPKCAVETQSVTANRGLERDATNNFGLVSTCATSEILKWNGTGWSCAADDSGDISQWTTITGGINYPSGNKVGINDATLSDTGALLQVGGSGYFANDLGVVGGGIFGGSVSASGGARFPRQPGTNITPGRGPSISLESPSNNVTTSKGTPDFCDVVGECSSDNTPNADVSAEYVCPVGSGGLSYSRDIFRDTSNNSWHQTITCVAGTDSYSLSTNAGTLEFTNTSGAVKLNLNQNGNVSFFGSLIIPGGSSGNVLTKNADGTASWQPSQSGADQWGTQVVQRDASLKGNGTTGALLGIMACSSNGQVLKWNGTGWGCAVDDSGGGSVWSSPDANGRISYTGGNVGIGTASPTGNFEVKNSQYLGTVSVGNGSVIVDGAGTTFLNTFKKGDTISVSGHGSRIVDVVSSNVRLTVTSAFSSTGTGLSYTATPNPNVSAFKVNGSGNTEIGGGLTVNQGGYFGGTASVNLLQVRGGSPAAGKFLKSTDANGNAVWDTVPAAYTDANVETWAEAKLADGDFSASPSTAKIKSTLLPALAITDTFPITAANSDTQAKCQTAVTGLTAANKGDVAICAGINKTYILTVEGGRATFTNWSEIKAPNQVTSVNGQTGAVTININDADADPANELQTLSLSGNTVSISKVSGTGASIALPQGSKWSDNVAPVPAGINYTGGNVGIGGDPTRGKLDVKGGVALDGLLNFGNGWGAISNTDGNGRFNIYSNTTGTSNAVYANSEAANRITLHTDGIKFFTAPTGTAGEAVTWTERMRIANNGNVGIGTAPVAGANLDINGTTRTNGFNVTGNAFFEGNVGIGISDTQGYKMAIEASTDTFLKLNRTGSPYPNFIKVTPDGGMLINNNNYDTLSFVGGNVAVGNVLPSAIFTIHGKTPNEQTGTLTLGNETNTLRITNSLGNPSFNVGDVIVANLTDANGGYTGSVRGIYRGNNSDGTLRLSGGGWNIFPPSGRSVGSGQSYTVSARRDSDLFVIEKSDNSQVLKVDKDGDLTATGDVSAKSVTATGIISNSGGEMSSKGTASGYSFDSRGAGGNAERWVLYAPDDTTVALWTNNSNKMTVSDTGAVSATGVVSAAGGVRINTAGKTSPTCNSSNRGLLWFTTASGASDGLSICLNTYSGFSANYHWVDLYPVPSDGSSSGSF